MCVETVGLTLSVFLLFLTLFFEHRCLSKPGAHLFESANLWDSLISDSSAHNVRVNDAWVPNY